MTAGMERRAHREKLRGSIQKEEKAEQLKRRKLKERWKGTL